MMVYFFIDENAAYFTPPKLRYTLYAMTFVFTFLMPALNVLFLLRYKFIGSLHMIAKEERRIPFLITAIFFFAQIYLLRDVNIPSAIKLLMLAATLALVLTIIINWFWKISAHMVGAGGLCGAVFICQYAMHQNYLWLLSLLFLLSGLVAMARLKITNHTIAQLCGGYLLGFASNLVFLF